MNQILSEERAADLLYEAQQDQLWEQENADPYTYRTETNYYLDRVWDKLCKVNDDVAEALRYSEGYATEDKIEKVYDAVERMQDKIREIQREVKGA